ncbi:hypothetical protein DPX16_11785 [Anabarilius grahami]|uniref:Uncharacterized protein n=1 Tax=Anabarilius grahami TaxID=495550 RepID=A0A3N0Z834_ANAGA|nr:hypothetical protein DPX16_11785 [Anabarilius grahami]
MRQRLGGRPACGEADGGKGPALQEQLTLRLLDNNKAGESHTAKRSIVRNRVQSYIVQTGVDTDGETQEEVTTFRMHLDVSERLVDKFM